MPSPPRSISIARPRPEHFPEKWKPVFRRKCDQISKEFSFRDGNLFLLATDEEEPTRVRIMISAQRDKTGAYAGQIFVDMGGNQLMLHNGPVRCTVGPG